MLGTCIAVVLWDVASRICLIKLVAFLGNCHQAFSFYAKSESKWCIHRVVLTASWKKMCFILSDRFDFHMTDSQSIADHAFTSHVLM